VTLSLRPSALLGPDWYILQADGSDIFPGLGGSKHEWCKLTYAMACWEQGTTQLFTGRRIAVYVNDNGVYFWDPHNEPATHPPEDERTRFRVAHSAIPDLATAIEAAFK